MKNLPRRFSKHERSTAHIQSQIAFKTFGSSRIDLALNEQRRVNISIHNAKVKENRNIWKDLINATYFPAKHELAFRSNDERASSSNRGNYVELLHAFAKKDERLATHLETSTMFSGLSNKIQNDLIEAVIRNYIKREIDAAPFVAVEVDETTDVTNIAQISVILRYVAKSEVDCEVKEGFLGFDDVSDDRRAPAVATYVLEVLEKYGCVEKLVMHTNLTLCCCIQQNVCLSVKRFLKPLRDWGRCCETALTKSSTYKMEFKFSPAADNKHVPI